MRTPEDPRWRDAGAADTESQPSPDRVRELLQEGWEFRESVVSDFRSVVIPDEQDVKVRLR